MSAALFAAQRLSAVVLALAVAVHLGTIMYAVRGGLTAGEILGQVLLSTVNIAYYQALMAGMREAIAAGHFADFYAATMAGWAGGDIAAL